MRFLPMADGEVLGFLRTSRTRAFHLETQDDYIAEDEIEPIRAFLAGESVAEYGETWGEYDELVKDLTGRGVAVQRVRIVTEPHTDYTRFALATTPRNLRIGEDVRFLPRHHVRPEDYTADDWWLLDNDTVAFTVFLTSGEYVGFAVTTDPVIVAQCREVRDRVWPIAVPYDAYVRA